MIFIIIVIIIISNCLFPVLLRTAVLKLRQLISKVNFVAFQLLFLDKLVDGGLLLMGLTLLL
jgi:hypothetical protein